MKLVIDNINTVTGWSGSSGATIHGLNYEKDYIAGNNNSSVIFSFNGTNSYIEKTYGTDTTNYDELILWVYSVKKGKTEYNKTTDFDYKIDLGTGKEFYMPAWNDFYYINIDISNIDTIDRIRITALYDNLDYIVLSYFVVFKPVLPYDIFQGFKEQVEYYINENITLKNVGQITELAGKDNIEFSAPVDYLDRYMAIKIDDGVNSEIHQIISKRGNKFVFSSLYDGNVLLNSYTNADVFVYYPVEFGTTQKEIILPSITIWGFSPTRELIRNELDSIIDSVKSDSTFAARQVGQVFTWDILVDCEVNDEWELLGEISEIVRKTVGQKTIWVNGMKNFIDFTGPATELYPTESFDILPKIQYPINISVREELYNRQRLPETTTINFEAIVTE